jgi:HEAT repeat protein
MSLRDDRSTSGSGEQPPQKVRRLQTDVRTLILLVLCCGAFFWAWRRLSENYDPAIAEARSIQERAIQALRSGKPADRVVAIQHLTSHGDDAVAISSLIEAIEDPDASVRVAAANALGLTGSAVVGTGSGVEAPRAAVKALIRRSSDPEPRVRAAALASLGTILSTRPAAGAASPIDRRAVTDALAKRLGDHDLATRRSAIHALASPDPTGPSAPPEALRPGFDDGSAENRVEAIQGLVNFQRGLDPWMPTLLRLAEHDPDRRVREACLNLLTYPGFKPPLVTAAAVPALVAGLRSGDTQIRCKVARFLVRLGPEARAAIPDLLRILDQPVDPELEPFQALLVTEDQDPGSEAAVALGAIAAGTPDAKPVIAALTEVARSGSVIRRTRTAYALGGFGAEAAEAVPVLISILNDPKSIAYIREEMREARASARPSPLSAYVNGEAQAARALGKIAPETPLADEAVAALRTVLDSEAPYSRAAAAEALGHFGAKAEAAIPRLRALGDDRDEAVRNSAARALRLIEEDGEPPDPQG